MANKILKGLRDETGATAIEYGIIVAAVSVGLIAVIFLCGGTIVSAMTPIIGALAG